MAKKKTETGRVEAFFRYLDKEREHTRHLRNETLANGDVLDFYAYKKSVFIMQRFKATGGIEIYAQAPGGGIETAARFVQKTEELRAELQAAMDRESLDEVKRMLDRAIFGKS